MENKKGKIAFYLQQLSEMKIKRHDEEGFSEVCKERGIPAKYVSSLMDVIFPKTVTNVAWPPTP